MVSLLIAHELLVKNRVILKCFILDPNLSCIIKKMKITWLSRIQKFDFIWMLCISTSEHILAHAFAWLKMMKNIGKWWKKYLFHHLHERHTTSEFELICVRPSEKFDASYEQRWLINWNWTMYILLELIETSIHSLLIRYFWKMTLTISRICVCYGKKQNLSIERLNWMFFFRLEIHYR